MVNHIKLPQYAWFESREVEFPLPEHWQVDIHNIAGYNRPAMTPNEIETAITSPIGTPRIRDLAKGKKEVAIIFDDMSRITKAYKILPFVLDELSKAGIPDNSIRFIAAVGNHQALDRTSMVKKLGSDIVARYAVYNHCPFLNCSYVGTTSYGTKIEINNEFLQCDLKIGIGKITPHMMTGFSGGGKIVMPGIAAYSSIEAFHSTIHAKWVEQQRKLGLSPLGAIEGNPRNADVQEAAMLAGLDIKIDSIVNMWGETVALFVGALEPTYRAGVSDAKDHYLVPATTHNDIVIANTYTKVNEAYIGLANAFPAVTRKGGDAVLIANSQTGQVIHYLFGRFGKTTTGSLNRPASFPPHIRRLIVYNEYPEASQSNRFSDSDNVLFISDWGEVVRILEASYGANAKVAVFPSAEIQYTPPGSSGSRPL